MRTSINAEMVSTTSLLNGPLLQPKRLDALPPAPLASILLANYNYARYIGDSIESVLGQSYKNWELIVCDDGSEDDSLSVIQGYVDRDSRIQLLPKENGGHASAINLAYSHCHGDLICLLDSDDLFLSSKLERIIRECAGFPQAGLISHAVVRVNERRKRQGVSPLFDVPDGWLGPDVLRAGGVLPYAPPTVGISLRREVADLLFPLPVVPPLSRCPDQVIMRLAPLITVVKRMPDVLAEYRMHDSNTYVERHVTLASVTKQLRVSEALWDEQHRFLCGLHADLGAQLASLDESPLTALQEYLAAKLGKDPDVKKYHTRLLERLDRSGDNKLSFFWRISIFLPNFLFRPAINLLLGQGALKQFIARLRQRA
jgi:glycosyltransferase involved in cell wall biosynthesis